MRLPITAMACAVGCAGGPSVAGDVLTLRVPGYVRTCADLPVISVREGGAWRVVDSRLPPDGGYFLDDDYVEPSMGCDLVECGPAGAQLAHLVAYEPAGTRDGSPAFTSRSLTGRVRVVFPAFADAACRVARDVTTELDR